MLRSLLVTLGISGAARLTRLLVLLALTIASVLLPPTDATAQPIHQPCPAVVDVASCDADGDSIPDAVERVVCASAECWTGNADTNPHRVPKWASVVICGATASATGHEDRATR